MNVKELVRVGVIGLGNIGKQHIDNILSGRVTNCEISAVCSRGDSDTAIQLGVRHFTDYRDLCRSGICDAVIVATPTFSHFDIGSTALEAGLHVMIEKPIGLSVREGENLLSLKQSDQVFAVMLNQRADPLFVTMRDLINQGTLGTLTRFHWTMTSWFRPEVYFRASDWRATWRGEGGGLLVNQCIHNLDIFQWLCGMPISVRAFCRFGRYHDIEVEDEATAYFEYESGASGVFVGSTGEAPGVNRLDVVGDRGMLSFDGKRLVLAENESSTMHFSRETRDMFGLPKFVVHDITPDRSGNQHAEILSNFVRAILFRDALIAPAEESLCSLEIANSMLLSTWEGKTLELPLDRDRYQQALDLRIAKSYLREKANIAVNIDMAGSYR